MSFQTVQTPNERELRNRDHTDELRPQGAQRLGASATNIGSGPLPRVEEFPDSSPIAVVATDLDGNVTLWNQHAEIIYGATSPQVMGRQIPRVSTVGEENDAGVYTPIHIVTDKPSTRELMIRRPSGELVPVLINGSPVFEANGNLSGYVSAAVDLSERNQFEVKLNRHATSDTLTGLPNRTSFSASLTSALKAVEGRRSSVAVLLLDLDEFKQINTSFGHPIGDQLLVAAGQRLLTCLPESALLARFSGDEFAILLPEAKVLREATLVAERIQERLRQAFGLDGHEAYVTASIGVTLSSGSNTRAEDLLRAAEIALYQAKADGRSTFRVFESRMAERMTSRLGLETELRRALDRNELRVFYQPQVDLSTGAIVGAEALVRWEHPRRGLIAPGEFIPTAEQSGLIIPIGVWVLDEACRQTAEWRTLGAAGRRLFVGINLAGRQLRHPDFIKSVLKAAMTAGLPLRRLELELTERAVVEDVEGATELFNQLKRHKIRLAIDDFGTGYCSLSSLRRWPVDVIKIDRSFLADIDHDAGSRQLIEAMVRLARALDADVTAEGIETPSQLAWCKSIGVSRGQGFCFAPPLPAAAFEELLRSDHHYPVSPTGALKQANYRR